MTHHPSHPDVERPDYWSGVAAWRTYAVALEAQLEELREALKTALAEWDAWMTPEYSTDPEPTQDDRAAYERCKAALSNLNRKEGEQRSPSQNGSGPVSPS